MNIRPPLRVIKKEKELNSQDRYCELQKRYINGQFTFDCHCLIQKLVEKGRREPHMEGVELYRILMEVTKILMLNELEILFFGATVQQMQWKIIDNCLTSHIDDFRGLQPNLKMDNYSKKMQLSFLLIAYVVKLYLNEDMNIFQGKMRRIITVANYDKMYQEWVERMRKHFKFSPKNMNKLFRELDIVRVKKEEELEEVNYNQKVQELFTKLIDYEPKQNHAKRGYKQEETPMQSSQMEEHGPVAQKIPISIIQRDNSMMSMKSFAQRQSFNEILNKKQPSFIRNPSFNRNNSLMDDFMGGF